LHEISALVVALRAPKLATRKDLTEFCKSKGLTFRSRFGEGCVEVASTGTVGISEASIVNDFAGACAELLAGED